MVNVKQTLNVWRTSGICDAHNAQWSDWVNFRSSPITSVGYRGSKRFLVWQCRGTM